DLRMAESARDLGLAEEALARLVELARLDLGLEVDGLERDDPVDLWIAAEIDEAHRAAPDRLEQLVASHRPRHRIAIERRRSLRLCAADEALRDVAEPAVELCDPVEQVGRAAVVAARVEPARELVELGQQRGRGRNLPIPRPGLDEL